MTTLAEHRAWAFREMLDPEATFDVGRASVLLGAAGVGWFFVEAHRRGVVPTLDGAHRWLAKAKEALADRDDPWRALYKEAADAPLFRHFSGGIVSGSGGVHALALALAASQPDGAAAHDALRGLEAGWRFVRGTKLATLYSGSGGYALAARALASTFPRGSSVQKALTRLHHAAAKRTLETLAVPLAVRFRARRPILLGVAHGVGGEIWSGLGLRGGARVVRRRLEEYASLAKIDGDYIVWPEQSRGPAVGPMWGTFCNGVVGQGLLYTRAYERFGETRYLDLARRCAITAHALPPSNPTFCCGASGQAALLGRVADVTGDAGLRRKARARLAWAARAARASGERSLGLFQGLAAIALLLDAPNAERLPWPLDLSL